MPTTLYTNPGFTKGLIDPEYRHAASLEGFSQSLLTARNVSFLKSGAVKRRPNFVKKTGFNSTTTSWAAPGSTYDEDEPFLLIPFTGRNQFIIVVQVNPANAQELWIIPYDVANNSFDTRRTVVDSVYEFDAASVKSWQYVQAGPSLFIATEPNLVDPPGRIVRVYDTGAAANPLQTDQSGGVGVAAEFHGELSGFWTQITGTNLVFPTDLGTTHQRIQSDGAVAPASESVPTTDGVTDAANFAPAADEVDSNYQLYLSNAWYDISSVAAYNAAIPFQITLTGNTTGDHLSKANIKWRADTSANRRQGAKAITFYEGRLILGNTRQANGTRDDDEWVRIYMSAPADPYLIYPSLWNAYPDSPIEVQLWSPSMDSIQWIVGSRALFIGGKRGLSVIKPGITPTSVVQIPIDSLGADEVLPIVEASSVIYQSVDQTYIVRVDFNLGNDGYRITYLNDMIKNTISAATRLQLGTGFSQTPRCLYTVLDDGTMAVGHFNDDGSIAWAIWDTELGDINDVVALDNKVFVTVDDGAGGLALFELEEDADYCGDDEAAAAVVVHWRVSESALKNTKVGVIATISAINGVAITARTVYLGLFETEADGDIYTTLPDASKAYLEDIYDDYTFSSIVCVKPFGSEIEPTPAIPVKNEGTAFGIEHRIHKVRVGCVGTRSFKLYETQAQPISPMSQYIQELAQKTGFVQFTQGEWGTDDTIKLRNDGCHQFTLTTVVREVSA